MRILILSNYAMGLYKFRKELMERLVTDKHEVIVTTPNDDIYVPLLESLGVTWIETNVDRRGINPISDIRLILKYMQIMKEIKPDIIFSYTIKPNIYGSLASYITKNKQIVNITGTGNTFIKKNLLNFVAKVLYRISLRNTYKVFFQNKGDRDFFIKNKLVNDNYDLLPGSGVNLDDYQISDFSKDETINFIFIGRVMRLKGIEEYLEAAKSIKESHPDTNFYIAGFVEDEDYKQILNEYHTKGIIIYLGFQKDIKPWIEKCHCTVLPSHGGEGVPNVLLETAAMGRVCIASRIDGSMDVVEDKETGYLFNPADANDLINKLKLFLQLDNKTKAIMGLKARHKIEKEFDRNVVIEKYINEVS